jgi:hypothetical protein
MSGKQLQHVDTGGFLKMIQALVHLAGVAINRMLTTDKLDSSWSDDRKDNDEDKKVNKRSMAGKVVDEVKDRAKKKILNTKAGKLGKRLLQKGVHALHKFISDHRTKYVMKGVGAFKSARGKKHKLLKGEHFAIIPDRHSKDIVHIQVKNTRYKVPKAVGDQLISRAEIVKQKEDKAGLVATPKTGDLVEFASDIQLDAGPCTYEVLAASHGQCTVVRDNRLFTFPIGDMDCSGVTTSASGKTLWKMV